jgi:hypothetical protein
MELIYLTLSWMGPARDGILTIFNLSYQILLATKSRVLILLIAMLVAGKPSFVGILKILIFQESIWSTKENPNFGTQYVARTNKSLKKKPEDCFLSILVLASSF